MPEKNNNSEKRWLTWAVRIIIPALIAMMWLNLAGELDDLRDEVRALRFEVRGEQAEQAESNRGQDERLARLETVIGLLWDDGFRE